MARLKVIVSGGFSVSYRQLLPEFEGSTGITVATLSGASQGKGPETIAAQLSRGVAADVAILSREGLSELMAADRIVAGTDVDLARAALGAAVHSRTGKPDIGTVAAFKQALLNSRVVAVPASTSGIYLTTDLFPRLGIADKLNIRIMPRGSQSAALVAAGDADIAVQPISELLREPGLNFLGPIPAELQLVQTFSAALACGAAWAQRKPVALVQGTQVGKAAFPPGDTARGGNGQAVDGIEALEREMLKTHFHSHLAIFYRGRQIAVPYGIGIVKPFQAEDGFVGSVRAIYWVHTHDATGIIHVESPDERTYTLGNFFDIWGRPLTPDNVAGLRGKVRAYVDGKPYEGNPRQITLGDHTEITLVVGAPKVTPPRYEFPEGL